MTFLDGRPLPAGLVEQMRAAVTEALADVDNHWDPERAGIWYQQRAAAAVTAVDSLVSAALADAAREERARVTEWLLRRGERYRNAPHGYPNGIPRTHAAAMAAAARALSEAPAALLPSEPAPAEKTPTKTAVELEVAADAPSSVDVTP